MSDDCSRGHASNLEETFFQQETQRLIEQMRRMLAATAEQLAAQAEPRPTPQHRERSAA